MEAIVDPISDFLEANIRVSDITFDIGANRGKYTRIMAERASKVLAFEPDPRSAKHLRDTVSLPNVEVVAVAVSDRAGSVDFYLDLRPNLGGVASSVNRLKGLTEFETVTVPTMSIDQFCAERKLSPRLLKIDVEGHEAAVIRGAASTIKGCRPFIIFEFWQSWWQEAPNGCAAAGCAVEQIFDFLHSEGYDLRIVQTGEPAFEHYKKNTEVIHTSVDIACYP